MYCFPTSVNQNILTFEPMELTKEDLEILNSKIGIKHLLENKKIDLEKALYRARYELKLREIQVELVKMQLWLIANNKKLVVLFHGGDSSEKSGVIRKILSHNNPRHYRVEVNLPHRSDGESGEWYFKKFVEKLPQPGEMVLWDRSWYNRATIEPVHGLCSQEEYELFMGQVNEFEKMLVESGVHLIKFYFIKESGVYFHLSQKKVPDTAKLQSIKKSLLIMNNIGFFYFDGSQFFVSFSDSINLGEL
jgi:polyphosphate kinase